MLPYWFESALRPTFGLLWMVLGLGLPWALVALPRVDWRHRAVVAGVALAFGAAWLTAWMLVLGTLGGASQSALLTAPNVIVGTLPIAVIGVLLAVWTARRTAAPAHTQRTPIALDERLLIILIIAACVLRWLAAAWYPFVEYDPLWVYGYEGKLYALLGYIPQHIGYYPQFLPLQYTFAQLISGGIDDHAARAVLPLMHWGSILMSYTLGLKLINRRTGIWLAAIWALYPHVGTWSTVGDLEIPLTFAFTGASAFFLAAWLGRGETRAQNTRYALIGGLLFGVAMFTKPTAGAFVLGVGLLVAAEALRVQLNLRALWPRLRIAILTGIACIPLGAFWYIRNILLGHPAIDFPNPFWLTQAMRSGLEFGWPVLAAVILCAALYIKGGRTRPNLTRLILAAVLFTAALLPSIIQPHRMGGLEWLAFAAGLLMLAWALLPIYAMHAPHDIRRDVQRIGWLLLLAFPYFVVWFYSYSYHYRLSFAIVPLMILPVAAVIARWLPAQRPTSRRLAPWIGLPLILLALPGLFAPVYHFEGGWDYLWSNEYPDDFSRLRSRAEALTYTMNAIRSDIPRRDLEQAVILAPGVQRFPFFFPTDDVRNTITPTGLDALEDVDYFVYSQEGRWFYAENGQPENNPITGAMGRPEVMEDLGAWTDSSFFGRVYRVRPPDRWNQPPRDLITVENPPEWGDFGRLMGYRLNDPQAFGSDSSPRLLLTFEGLAPASQDLTLFVHLVAPDGSTLHAWDSLPLKSEFAHYATTFWQSGDILTHRTDLTLPSDVTVDPAATYTVQIGWYDVFDTGERTPRTDSNPSDATAYTLPFTLSVAP
jgi:4-amino-4-deoxy-L-arabinose transferase-like glycosyltransferase